MSEFMSTLVPASAVLPLSVFFAELAVVTLGTMRIIFVSRGMRVLAPVLGMFEIIIWLFAISQIMQNLSNVGCYVAFAAGFTTGNYLGILIERRLALGTLVVRLTTNKPAGDLIDALRTADYGVTCMEGQGASGPVQVIFTVIKRKELNNVVTIINRFHPKAFFSVDELQSAAEGIFPDAKERTAGIVPNPLKILRMVR